MKRLRSHNPFVARISGILDLYLLQILHLSTLTIFLPHSVTVSHSSHVTVLNSLSKSCFHFLYVSYWIYHFLLSSSSLSTVLSYSLCLFILFHYYFMNIRHLPPDVFIFDRLITFFTENSRLPHVILNSGVEILSFSVMFDSTLLLLFANKKQQSISFDVLSVSQVPSRCLMIHYT